MNTMPSANATEREVLGAVLLGRLPLHDLGRIHLEDWGAPDHRTIHEIIRRVSDRTGGEVDLASVIDAAGKLSAKVGDIAASATMVVASYDTHIASIRETAMRRRLMKAATRIAETATSAETITDALGAAMSSILDISDAATTGSGPASAKEALERWVDAAHDALDGKRDPGLRTGWPAVDDLTQGLHRGELVIIAGRPSMGKSTIGQNIAEKAALDGRAVLVVDLEMPEMNRMSRMISSLSGVDLDRLRDQTRLTDADWPRVSEVITKASAANIHFDKSCDTIDEVVATARAHHARHGLDLLVVDYLQLIESEGENRNIQVGRASRRLKRLAVELDCLVIALAQLNRDIERRADPRPMLSDLRDSGSLEQDADRVLFLTAQSVDDKTRQLIFAKVRDGRLGTVDLTFDGARCRFTAPDPYAAYSDYRRSEVRGMTRRETASSSAPGF